MGHSWMAAIRRAIANQPLNGRGLVRRPLMLALGAITVVLLLGGIASCSLTRRGSDTERGTSALVEAFSRRRLIEARLSGGFKAGHLNPDASDRGGIDDDRLDTGRELVTKAAATGDPQAQLAYGRVLLLEGKQAPALRRIRSAVKSLPNSAEAHNDLGVSLFVEGKLEEALDEFEAALERLPDMPEASFNRALCYQRLLLNDAATDTLEHLVHIERDPGWLKEIDQRLQDVSRPPETQRSSSQAIAAFEAAVSDGRIDEARRLADIESEELGKHALWDLSIRQLQAGANGNQEEAARALVEIELIGGVLIETRADSMIADFAKYLRSLPRSECQAELELIRDYVEALKPFKLDDDARVTFERLERMFRDRANYAFQAISAFEAAECYYVAKRFRDSIDKLTETLSLIGDREWSRERAKILNLLAYQFSRLGRDSLAINYSEEAISLCDKSPQLEAKL
ncbi:MAG TPA: tetratricopeptide repeat protein, partial [Blastocatellia bacterium]|nr:tetratricopeptide repeat protein [Blastocatellia bacterium]